MRKLLRITRYFSLPLLIVLIAAVSVLFSCRLNTPPLVEIEEGDNVSVINGATAMFTTTVTDPDEGQEITYQWFVDGEAVDGATDAEFGYVTGPVNSAVEYTVRVVATDERGGTGEDSSVLTVNPADFYPLDRSGDFEFSIDLGPSAREVYFLFTNTTVINQTTLPSVTQSAGSRSLSAPSLSGPSASGRSAESGGVPPPGTRPIAQRGSPEISKFNNSRHDFGRRISPRDLYGGGPEPPLMDSAAPGSESTGTFTMFNRSGYSSVDATCRSVVSADGKTLNIWVEDAFWEGSPTPLTEKVNTDMVDVLADKFLKTGDSNDIYEWISGIFGDEWGNHSYDNLIPPNDEITILLYDIDKDGMPGSGDSRIVGLFDSTHNFKQSYYTNSNERIMFGLDAVLFADDTGNDGWSLEDYWPQEVISTLAHEFQHMIHFYQKNILRSGAPDTWLNEMCSVMAEDFVSDKLGVRGPRGVDPSDGSAGSPYITEGRLPLFNFYNDLSLIDWGGYLEDYSLVYSFGAYLGRNFGGADFFRNIVRNAKGGYDAVEFALNEMGYDYDFWDVLRRWGVGVVYSDSTAAPDNLAYNLEYNKGDWFTTASGGITYNLGSINLYNYEYNYNGDSQQGPYFYENSPVGGWTDGSSYVHYKTATSYYLAGTGISGQNSWNFSLPSGVRVTVVLK